MPVISKSNPVNWGHPLNYKRLLWYKCLPGDNHAKIRELTYSKYRNFQATSGLPKTGMGNGNGPWGSKHFTSANSERLLSTSSVTEIGAANTSFSVAAWVFHRTNVGNPCPCYIGAGSSWACRPVVNTSSGKIEFGMYNGSINPRADSANSKYTLNTWARIVGVRDCENSVMKIYFNGVDVTNTSTNSGFATNFSSSYSLEIGGSQSGVGNYTNGYIDDVSIWNGRALTASDVWMDYDLSRRGYPGVLNRVPPTAYFIQPASSFQSAWARGSNVIIRPGVLA